MDFLELLKQAEREEVRELAEWKGEKRGKEIGEEIGIEMTLEIIRRLKKGEDVKSIAKELKTTQAIVKRVKKEMEF